CLASMAAPGTDIILSDDRLAGARNFANKIWNAARFLFVNLDKFEQGGTGLEELAGPEVRGGAPYAFNGTAPLVDAWLFSRLASITEQVNDALANYRFHEAAQGVYQFFWGDFCDWYIEWVKPDLQNADRQRAVVAWKNLFAAFNDALRLLHPFMPFLTEELWHQLPQAEGAKSIALDRFPELRTPGASSWQTAWVIEDFQLIQNIIVTLRNVRAEKKMDPKTKVVAEIYSSDVAKRSAIEQSSDGIVRLAQLSDLKISTAPLIQGGGVVRSTAQFDVKIVDTADVLDVSAEKVRLNKEISGLQKAIASKEAQLANELFRSKAPEEIICGMEGALAEQRVELKKREERLRQL
ncbi:MAG TPA: class I tRNA ligase family protein, partial [Candidatus Acidoferrum sp.]|nr:class I tRNA ligase family protein [Candidatus Acidoferrum sp.]